MGSQRSPPSSPWPHRGPGSSPAVSSTARRTSRKRSARRAERLRAPAACCPLPGGPSWKRAPFGSRARRRRTGILGSVCSSAIAASTSARSWTSKPWRTTPEACPASSTPPISSTPARRTIRTSCGRSSRSIVSTVWSSPPVPPGPTNPCSRRRSSRRDSTSTCSIWRTSVTSAHGSTVRTTIGPPGRRCG